MPAPDARESARLFDETPVHEEAAAHLTPSERTRIRDTLAMIPPGTTSLLDVGCGRGVLLHEMEVPFIVGTDLARRGIRYVKRPAVVSSMLALPFPDRSFDVVLCAEAMEHLDPAMLPAAAAELRRVARRAVVVTVPFDENPLEGSSRCPRCGAVFHLHGHQRSFLPDDLRGLFPSAAAYEVRGSWPIRRYSPALLRFRTGTLGLWKFAWYARCPSCGNRAFENHEHRMLYRLAGTINSFLHPRKRRWRWLLFRADLEAGGP
jgi:SAM-dependent methyltransferase